MQIRVICRLNNTQIRIWQEWGLLVAGANMAAMGQTTDVPFFFYINTKDNLLTVIYVVLYYLIS